MSKRTRMRNRGGKQLSAEEQETLKVLHDTGLALRKPGCVEWREAVVGNNRMEYFRGKDLMEYLLKNPSNMDPVLTGRIQENAQLSPEEKVAAFAHIMLASGLIVRADRLDADKVPRPGKKRVVKWPKKLVTMKPREQTWDPKSLYIWSFARPLSPWTYIGSVALVLIIAAGCFYPLAPLRLKWVVLYVTMGLLVLILSLIAVRALLFAAVWLITGRHVWFLPLLFADVSIKESFSVFVEESKDEDGTPIPRASLWMRGLIALAIIGLGVTARSVGPKREKVSEKVKTMNRSVLNFFDLLESERRKSIANKARDAPTDARDDKFQPDSEEFWDDNRDAGFADRGDAQDEL